MRFLSMLMIAARAERGLTQIKNRNARARSVGSEAFMQVPLQIVVRSTPHSPALDARIREKALKLEEFAPRIISCRVTVEEGSKHRHQGRQFSVRIDLRVPGREIAVTREHHEDVYVALRDAFDSAKRQLEDVVREMRGDVKAHNVEGDSR
jgi:ribosomal subunit interface protein